MRPFSHLKNYLLLFLKGISMGAADVVPGVSGGTIALITGIYGELVDSLRSIDLQAMRLLFAGKISSFWTRINGFFLLTLFSGILVSIFSLAKLLEHLLTNYAIQVWSFFFGLVMISSYIVIKKISAWNLQKVVALITGIIAMVLVTKFSPVETTEAYWFIFLSGAIAICTMILPGISGAFILLILGKYQFILQAVSSLNIPVLLVFGIGVVFGLLSFSNLLSWLLKRHYDVTIALLSGFILGSLNKIWPWKETISSSLNSHGELIPVIQRNISPAYYSEISGTNPMLLSALMLFLCGVALVLILEFIAKKAR